MRRKGRGRPNGAKHRTKVFLRAKNLLALTKQQNQEKKKNKTRRKKEFRTEKEKKRKSVTAKYGPVLRFLTHTKPPKVVYVLGLQETHSEEK